MNTVETVANRLAAVREEIGRLEARYGRTAGSVSLLAVSKTKPVEAVREAFSEGQRAFGENHLQDALTKIEPLADLGLEWHFIGTVQSNKTRAIAEHFDWVQSIERVKIARRLNDQRPDDVGPLNVCIEVNSSGETTKGGVAFDAVAELADEIRGMPRLRLRGLMTIPAPGEGLERQREPFARVRGLFETIAARIDGMDTLSMGMTNDLEAAIAEGATMVRIGTAIFGARDYPT